MPTFRDDGLAVDEHVWDGFGVPVWVLEGGIVDNGIWVEHDEVGYQSFFDPAAIAKG